MSLRILFTCPHCQMEKSLVSVGLFQCPSCEYEYRFDVEGHVYYYCPNCQIQNRLVPGRELSELCCGQCQEPLDTEILTFVSYVIEISCPGCGAMREYDIPGGIWSWRVKCPECGLAFDERDEHFVPARYLEAGGSGPGTIGSRQERTFNSRRIGSTMKAALAPRSIYPVYTSSRELRCTLFTLIVRNKALEQHYEGGTRAFVTNYSAQCNQHITVLYATEDNDLEEPAQDLRDSGLKEGEDYLLFDTHTLLVQLNPSVSKDLEFQVSWLRGHLSRSGIWVYYSR